MKAKVVLNNDCLNACTFAAKILEWKGSTPFLFNRVGGMVKEFGLGTK